METNVSFLKHTVNSQAEVTEKVNTLPARMEKLHEQTVKTINEVLNTHRETAKTKMPNENITVNVLTPAVLQTPTQYKFFNQINIKACQLLIKYESDTHNKVAKPINNKKSQPTFGLKKQSMHG